MHTTLSLSPKTGPKVRMFIIAKERTERALLRRTLHLVTVDDIAHDIPTCVGKMTHGPMIIIVRSWGTGGSLSYRH